MNLTLLIITLAIGLILLTLEIVALPGGIAGLFGLLMTGFGVWQAYHLYGTTVGLTVLLCSIAICAVLLIIFMRTKTWKRFSLNEESGSKVNQIDTQAVTLGARGRTVARLAPTGKALIDGQLVEVHAVNRYIEPDQEIEVVAIDGYRVDVCQTSDPRFEEPQSSTQQQ